MKKKLRIATMVTGHYTIPAPDGIVYAPMDVAAEISQGMVEKGHEVTFYAPEGSHVSGVTMKSDGILPLKEQWDHLLEGYTVTDIRSGNIETIWDQLLIANMFRAAEKGEFDLLHIHPVIPALPLSISNPSVPVVYTLHDPVRKWRYNLMQKFTSPNQWYVSISDAQRVPAPDLNYIRTVYNGVNVEDIPFSDKKGSHLLFVGRIIPNKGVVEAIETAHRLNEKLIIIGPNDTDPEYWEKQVKPMMSDNIVHLGFVDRKDLYQYYQDAKALLFPIQWEEPFGLVMIEAMSTGTPVVAFGRGSVPEVIKDGVTGYIVHSLDEMVDAVTNIDSIDRAECRKQVENNFSLQHMVDGYEHVYQSIVDMGTV